VPLAAQPSRARHALICDLGPEAPRPYLLLDKGGGSLFGLCLKIVRRPGDVAASLLAPIPVPRCCNGYLPCPPDARRAPTEPCPRTSAKGGASADLATKYKLFAVGGVGDLEGARFWRARGQLVLGLAAHRFGRALLTVARVAKVSRPPAVPRGYRTAELALVFNRLCTVLGTRG